MKMNRHTRTWLASRNDPGAQQDEANRGRQQVRRHQDHDLGETACMWRHQMKARDRRGGDAERHDGRRQSAKVVPENAEPNVVQLTRTAD